MKVNDELTASLSIMLVYYEWNSLIEIVRDGSSCSFRHIMRVVLLSCLNVLSIQIMLAVIIETSSGRCCQIELRPMTALLLTPSDFVVP